MKKYLFIFILIFLPLVIFSQEKIYRSSYDINILKETDKGNFGFGIETSQGVRVWRYFIVSANLGYNRYTQLDKNILYLTGEVKWFLYNIKNDDHTKPYLFFRLGSLVKLANNFVNGSKVGLGFGFLFNSDYDVQYNLSLVAESEGSGLTIDRYNVETLGVRFGISF